MLKHRLCTLQCFASPSYAVLKICPRPAQLHRNIGIVPRSNVIDSDGDVEFSPEEVSTAEAASFERIAANLVARMEGIEDIPDGDIIHRLNCGLHA